MRPDTTLPNKWPHNANHERSIGTFKSCMRAAMLQSGFPAKNWDFAVPYCSVALPVTHWAPILPTEQDADGNLLPAYKEDKENRTCYEAHHKGLQFYGPMQPFGRLCFYLDRQRSHPLMSVTRPGFFCGWVLEAGFRYRDTLLIADYSQMRTGNSHECRKIPAKEVSFPAELTFLYAEARKLSLKTMQPTEIPMHPEPPVQLFDEKVMPKEQAQAEASLTVDALPEFRITRLRIEHYGPTILSNGKTCPGCLDFGKTKHAEECRLRFYRELKKDGHIHTEDEHGNKQPFHMKGGHPKLPKELIAEPFAPRPAIVGGSTSSADPMPGVDAIIDSEPVVNEEKNAIDSELAVAPEQSEFFEELEAYDHHQSAVESADPENAYDEDLAHAGAAVIAAHKSKIRSSVVEPTYTSSLRDTVQAGPYPDPLVTKLLPKNQEVLTPDQVVAIVNQTLGKAINDLGLLKGSPSSESYGTVASTAPPKDCLDFKVDPKTRAKGNGFDFNMEEYCQDAVDLYCEAANIPLNSLKKVTTPFCPEGALLKADDDTRGKLSGKACSVLMKALWLARLARPDLQKAITDLATRIQKWSRNDDRRVRRLYEYIYHTKHYRMQCFVRDPPEKLELHAYVDADFAGYKEDTKSTSGGILVLAGPTTWFPLAWTSKRQTSTSRSTTESEVVSLATFLFGVFSYVGFMGYIA